VNAERPNGGGQSFPSGHASVSFSSAEFLRKRYGWGWGLPAYALASFVAYSRVEAGKHYTRDVVAGAALGGACSYLFTDAFVKTEVQAGAGGYYGVRLSATW
jgi:membrane-associated phospholipid phosphatase